MASPNVLGRHSGYLSAYRDIGDRRVTAQLHDSEINARVQTFHDAGMWVWIGDEANGIRAE